MAFPYIFESNFESGFNDEWDSQTDVAGILTIKHYSQLARYDVAQIGPIAPFRGAFVAEWDLVGDTSDHILIEGDVDIADTVTRQTRFYIFLGRDFRATADDTFNVYEHQGTANAVEFAIGLRITAATQAVEVGVGQIAPTVFASEPLQRGRWYCIEIEATAATVAGNGAADLYVDGNYVATIDNLTNTAVLRGVLGTQNTLTTTLGHIFMDAFVHDDTFSGPIIDRYPERIMVTKSMHICMGGSQLLNVTLINGAGTNNTLTIYDTDVAYADASVIVAYLNNVTSSEPPIDLADVPLDVTRGAFVVLAGTNPRALIHIGRSDGYYSTGRVRAHGQRRGGATFAG